MRCPFMGRAPGGWYRGDHLGVSGDVPYHPHHHPRCNLANRGNIQCTHMGLGLDVSFVALALLPV